MGCDVVEQRFFVDQRRTCGYSLDLRRFVALYLYRGCVVGGDELYGSTLWRTVS